MNAEEERRKIRRQFKDSQWSELLANADFKSAWDNGNLTLAGEIANRVLFPQAENKQERREGRQLIKILDEFT